jgi:LCP family protein required for cell wall assembly
MANGRPPDDGSSHSSRRRRDKGADLGGLEALGQQIGTNSPSDSVANESGLQALGARIDESDGRRGGRVRGERRDPGGAGGGGRGGRGRSRWSTRRKILIGLSSLVVLALLAVGGGYLYLQRSIDSINGLHVSNEVPAADGAPFTVLVIGSDTRVGQNSADFGSSTAVAGQRSDVVQLWRVTPSKKQVQVMSIPRDTVVSMIGSDVNTFGQFNRINSAFDAGTDQLVKTITANFGIPINHVAEIDFSGFEDAVNSVGGTYLNFNYPAKDAYSDLAITTPGCQLLNGAQSLAVARSRHYEYYQDGEWHFDGTSDFGRIQRQDAFLRSLIAAVKSKETNPIALAKFAGSLHKGLQIDDGFSANELIGLAETYHSFDGSELAAQTLPTENSSAFSGLGDVLVADQPAAQQMLVNIFGSSLVTPTNPPPNVNGVAEAPPTVTPTTAPPSTSGTTATPTTVAVPSFDPTPCTPS